MVSGTGIQMDFLELAERLVRLPPPSSVASGLGRVVNPGRRWLALWVTMKPHWKTALSAIVVLLAVQVVAQNLPPDGAAESGGAGGSKSGMRTMVARAALVASVVASVVSVVLRGRSLADQTVPQRHRLVENASPSVAPSEPTKRLCSRRWKAFETGRAGQQDERRDLWRRCGPSSYVP